MRKGLRLGEKGAPCLTSDVSFAAAFHNDEEWKIDVAQTTTAMD